MRHSDLAKLDNMFLQRWSPRAFSAEPIDSDELMTIFEAARWSPSCFNEQPWRFVYAKEAADLERFRAVLAESNQVWANTAPVLLFVFSKKTFTHHGKPNRWADFDSGTAWMALSLQANKLGLHTHAMGGYDAEQAYVVCGVNPDEYNVLCAVAIGKIGDVATLPDNLKATESPNARKPLQDTVFESTMA